MEKKKSLEEPTKTPDKAAASSEGSRIPLPVRLSDPSGEEKPFPCPRVERGELVAFGGTGMTHRAVSPVCRRAVAGPLVTSARRAGGGHVSSREM